MIQSRTHNCNELRIGNAGERVTLVGWFENMRKVSKNLGFFPRKTGIKGTQGKELITKRTPHHLKYINFAVLFHIL